MSGSKKRFRTSTTFGAEWLVISYVAYSFAFVRPHGKPPGLDPWLGYPLLLISCLGVLLAVRTFFTKPHFIGISQLGLSFERPRRIEIWTWGVVKAIWGPEEMGNPGIYIQLSPDVMTPADVLAGLSTGATVLLPRVTGISETELINELKRFRADSEAAKEEVK